jgi:hypothetical protein
MANGHAGAGEHIRESLAQLAVLTMPTYADYADYADYWEQE